MAIIFNFIELMSEPGRGKFQPKTRNKQGHNQHHIQKGVAQHRQLPFRGHAGMAVGVKKRQRCFKKNTKSRNNETYQDPPWSKPSKNKKTQPLWRTRTPKRKDIIQSKGGQKKRSELLLKLEPLPLRLKTTKLHRHSEKTNKQSTTTCWKQTRNPN